MGDPDSLDLNVTSFHAGGVTRAGVADTLRVVEGDHVRTSPSPLPSTVERKLDGVVNAVPPPVARTVVQTLRSPSLDGGVDVVGDVNPRCFLCLPVGSRFLRFVHVLSFLPLFPVEFVFRCLLIWCGLLCASQLSCWFARRARRSCSQGSPQCFVGRRAHCLCC